MPGTAVHGWKALHNSLVQATRNSSRRTVGQNADVPEVPSFGHILQLSRQLARLAWLGDETVANDNQVLSLLSASRTIASARRNAIDSRSATRDRIDRAYSIRI